MDKNVNLKIRIITYFTGFLIMTMGIAFSVKSNLGVSPVSSIPYTMTCVWGIEMGKATILFHIVLVLVQIGLLRKNFEKKNLLQIPVGIIFGYFTTFCNYLVSFTPTPTNIFVRLLMIWISTVLVAIGIFMYVPSNIMPLAGEGVMLAVSKVSGIAFERAKIMFDVSMVVISLVTCLLVIKSLGSVGIGTIIAAVLVGVQMKLITNKFGKYRDKILKGNIEETVEVSM